MAVTYGTAKGSGGTTTFRVGIELLIPTPGPLDVSVTVTTKVWVWTKDKVTDPSASLTLSGDVAAATVTIGVTTPSNADWSTRNKVLVHTATKSIPTSSIDQAITSTASVTGIEAAGGSTVATVTVKGTLKKSPVTAPVAPSGLTATVVGNVVNLTWTNVTPTLTGRPYVNILLERWDNVTNAWYKMPSLKVVTSFSDVSSKKDREYQYRIASSNGGGSSATTSSAIVQTIPEVPRAPIAVRPAVNAEISWTVNSTIATQYRVWRSVNGTMDGAPLATVPVATTNYTHVGASTTVTHVYYLQAVGASLSSAIGPGSLPLLPGAPPLSPSNLAPSGGTLDAAVDITLQWDHNAKDGTTQVGFKPRWREQGTAAWTLPVGLSLSGSANATTDAVTCAGHMFSEGDVVRFTGTAPSPLVVGTQYFAIPIDATSFKVALTEEAAEDAIAIDLTTTGGPFNISTGRIVLNTSAYVIPGGTLTANKAYEYTVATDGRYVGVNPSSPWASVAGFRTATKPTLTLSYPEDGGVTGSPQALVAWVFFSPDPDVVQQWAEVTLWQGSTLLESYEASSDWSSFTFQYDIVNGATYRVEVEAEGTNGIRSDIYSATFTPEYVGPLAPGISLDWDSTDGVVVIDISNEGDLDAPAAVSNDLWRSVGGSAWELIRSGLGVDTTVVDYLPTPNKINSYRIITKAVDGSKTTATAAILCDNTGDWYWLNAGDDFDILAKVRYSGGVNVDFSLDGALHKFDGRTKPLAFSGTIQTFEIELKAKLPRDAEGYATMADLMAVARQGGDIYYRDPVGRRLRCSLAGISFNDEDNLIDFSASLTEVDA